MLPIAIALLSLLLGLVIFLYSINIFQANPTWVNAIAITRDGQTAVSATATRDLTVNVVSPDSSVKVWNLRWGTQTHVLRGHYYGVTAVALTPDGKRAVSASRDRTLKVWDIRRGTLLHTLKGHREWVTSVVVTPDGNRAVSASGDKTLKIWDIKTGKVLQTLNGHSDVISAVALTSDGQRAVSASADKTLKVWDLEQGQELYTLSGHSSGVTSIALTPNGEQAVSASADKTLKVWDLEQGKELYTLSGHSGWVTGVAVSPDGQRAVSAATDQTLKVWDLQQGTALGTLTGHNGWVTSVAIAPDGRQAVSASSDQTLKVWDLQQFKALHTLSGHHAWVTAIAITPKIPRIISASFQGYPKLWSLERGTELPMRGVVAQAVGLNIGLGTVLPLAILTGAISVAILLASGVMAFGVPGTIVSSFIPGVMSSLIFCVVFVVTARIAADPILNQQYKLDNASTVLTILFGILLGMIISVTFGLSSRTALGVLGSIVFILLLGAALGLIVSCLIAPGITLKGRLRPGIRAFETVSITFNLLVAFGAFRLLFYPVQLFLALLSRFRGKWHPAVWDELLVLPVPGTTALLQAHLRASEQEGLQRVAEVVRNPFQRVWAQRSLHHYLHSVAAPLHFLYHLLTSEDLNTYVVAPISQRDWQLLPTTKQVLLGELANQKVDCTSEGLNYLAENVVWGLTGWGRAHRHSPLTRFTAMLYQLSYTKIVEAKDFNLSSYKEIYTGLTQYPGGTEIADSFAALATFLTYENLSDLTVASDVVSELCVDETAIRPAVLKALTRCGEIGSKAITYQAAVTTVEQLAILAQMTSSLDLLEEYAIEQVVTPEQAILKRIIRQWRRVVSKAVVSAEC
jgi:WD40 repeat protein